MPRCLIIDDSPIIRRVARAIITDFGFEVHEAEHSRLGFEMCAIEMPDVVLLDWQLRSMGAYEFLKALRALEPSAWPYVIYCTTEFDFHDIQCARAAGAADFLMKPFDRRTLTATFEKLSYLVAANAPADTPRHDNARHYQG